MRAMSMAIESEDGSKETAGNHELARLEALGGV
jgi:hypothetical protein